jgi:hypothetical protein
MFKPRCTAAAIEGFNLSVFAASLQVDLKDKWRNLKKGREVL